MDSENLMDVLSRLSFSIDEAMRQKRFVEKCLSETTQQVKMLTEANDALMKHVAGLEKRNEVVVNGLAKIVGTVEQNCRNMHDFANGIETISIDEDSVPIVSDDTTLGSGEKDDVAVSEAPENVDVTVSAEQASEPTSKQPTAGEFDLDREPQSAELKSFSELHVDPLVFSNVMDYAAEPDQVLPQYHAGNSGSVWSMRFRSGRIRSGRFRSGRLRSGRIRLSRGLFGKRRQGSYVDGSRNVESLRSRKSGGIRHDVNGIPVPEATCGCFLKSIFGCRH